LAVTDWSVSASFVAIDWSNASAATDWSVALFFFVFFFFFSAIDWSNALLAATNLSVALVAFLVAVAIERSVAKARICETIERLTEWDLEEVDDLGLGLSSTGSNARLEIAVVFDPGIGIAVDKIPTAISGLELESWTELLFELLLLVVSLTKTVKL
jgi:hypothetical protein